MPNIAKDCEIYEFRFLEMLNNTRKEYAENCANNVEGAISVE
jgi:hypothetical protein